MRIPPRATIVVLSLALLAGCAAETVDLTQYPEGNPQQKYEYKEVKRLSKQLRSGMTQLDVMILLGSPADRQPDRWIYLPSKPTFLLPTEGLEVRFQRGMYLSHKTTPIVFGERITDP
ncbi:MAG: hypothetical protein ACYTGG_05470 [Planctomycetota bacterium]|jgi:outer membrane protein assembly factor BamE (lipoprotein component of BamABCDE complex)